MKISAVLIVKNEEAMLARCLESVKEADEIIICDTGSVDNTIEVAKRYTDKVYTDFTWNDSFADARNHAKSKATGDYILSIDADEFLHDFSVVRKAVESGMYTYQVTLICEANGQTHIFPRLFKNCSEIIWLGAVHNYLSKEEMNLTDISITYGQSPAHLLDPTRSLRILEKEVSKPGHIREMYYLGREYLYNRRFAETVVVLVEYIKMSSFLMEKNDAYLMLSQAYWNLGIHDKARESCLQAIANNNNFKEAILWMGAIDMPWNVRQWHAMAQTADNTNVLFTRVK